MQDYIQPNLSKLMLSCNMQRFNVLGLINRNLFSLCSLNDPHSSSIFFFFLERWLRSFHVPESQAGRFQILIGVEEGGEFSLCALAGIWLKQRGSVEEEVVNISEALESSSRSSWTHCVFSYDGGPNALTK